MISERATEDRSYRRGLVLGLTLAEIMVLIVFSLLLVWAVGANASTEAERALRERVATLEAQVQQLLGSSDAANRFDDFFKELVKAREERDTAQAAAAAMQELEHALRRDNVVHASPEDKGAVVEEIRRKAKIGQSVVTSLAVSTRDDDQRRVAQLAEELVRIHSAIKSTGEFSPARIGQLVEELGETRQELATLKGQLSNAQLLLRAGGRGTEHPACWAAVDSGKPEYIFDVALRSATLVVHDNALPHRAAEQARLPVEGIVFDTDLSPDQFRTMTRPLFEWSESHECRFFVRVVDVTAPHEKVQYKRQLRMVEEHFYKFEDASGFWR